MVIIKFFDKGDKSIANDPSTPVIEKRFDFSSLIVAPSNGCLVIPSKSFALMVVFCENAVKKQKFAKTTSRKFFIIAVLFFE